jgi:hypothetical protein
LRAFFAFKKKFTKRGLFCMFALSLYESTPNKKANYTGIH